MVIYPGTTVRLTCAFKNKINKTAVDPTTIQFKVETPSGTTTTYIYTVDAGLVRSDTGLYYIDIDLDNAGTYSWRWFANTSPKAADEGAIIVSESRF